MPITLSPDARKQLVASLKRYAAENLDEEIGDLKAGLLLDFCLAEVGAVAYNSSEAPRPNDVASSASLTAVLSGPRSAWAAADAQAYFQERTTDLDGVCHQREFTYWTAPPGKSR